MIKEQTMTSGDKAECREIAREIVEAVLIQHIGSCPHHAAYKESKARVFGIIVGVILASGATSSAAAAIIFKLFGT